MAEEKFTKEEVLRVAELARLSLTAEQIGTMGDELSSILAFISTLQEVDVDRVEATSHGSELRNTLREDTREHVAGDEEVRAKDIRSAFPSSRDNMLQVPPVLNPEES